MKRLIPLLILALGVVVASAWGARLGDRHAEYRAAQGVVANTEGVAQEAAVEARDAIGLPPPSQRVSQWFAEGGLGWLLGSGLILVGAVIARRQIAAEQAGGDAGDDRADFESVIQATLEVLDRIEPMLADLAMDEDCPKARALIDELTNEQLAPLVDARGQLIARHGLAAFAEYFGPFSAGERNLARVWSTITDGHAVEARRSLGASRSAFEQAHENWIRVEAAG